MGDDEQENTPKSDVSQPLASMAEEHVRGNDASEEIANITVKLPPFWHANPSLWIAQVESRFIAARIKNDATKHHTVIAAIESNVLAQTSDIILNPPTTDMYETLKAHIVERFAESEPSRIKKLLQELELGDMRPSQLLREMRNLAGNAMNDSMLKSVWLNRLPPDVRSIISISSEPLDKVACLADKITEVRDGPQWHAVSNAVNAAPNYTLAQQIEQLSKEITILKSRVSSQSRNRNRSSSRNRPRTPELTAETCWYHFKFGDNAKKCSPPCTKLLN
ncbi:PREDICTED: uncharacterized protein LOC108370205 [Rhagoletis zephyria]|uniref:uncharacterized protein LOC108370205 n=1 Tax=Rhagoletis zephyria TaxID=28612 RepID=UPI000811A637|nr:PREDICTED: uncharacterized protein LOC108370205 [Rhagoletis zephyria]XP_036340503.1 uncharacterized protein LOC118749829 [Rhagoletis pomonella]